MSDFTAYLLPDLISYCPFPLKLNSSYPAVADVSDEWMASYGVLEDKPLAERFFAAQFGLLTAMCFPEADAERFRLCCDYINCLFAFDDVEDDGDLKENIEGTRIAVDLVIRALRDPKGLKTSFQPAQMLASFWERGCKVSTPGAQRRFVTKMEQYAHAVYQQVVSRVSKEDLDVEAFIDMRRDTSALRPIWAVVEFALALDLPDEVLEHPILLKMSEAANDMVSWSNDMYSWNCEQARGHLSNLVNISMREHGLDLQGGINFVGDLVKASIDEFEKDKARLPRWGVPQIDDQVDAYVRGMEYWVMGSFEWSFDSRRYFGADHDEIKRNRIVTVWKRELDEEVNVQSAAIACPAIEIVS